MKSRCGKCPRQGIQRRHSKVTRAFNKVAVLKGGPSAEREISLRSGAAVARGLREAHYEVVEVDVTTCSLNIPAGVDGVFIALHGEFGEDGQVQDILNRMGIPYTGSGVEASRAAFDKRESKRRFEAAGVPTAPWEVLAETQPRRLPLPVVVKPPRQGSTIGISRVFREEEWAAALAAARVYDRETLVEAYVPGRELTVGVLDGEALPVIEIVPPNDWYDFGAKYQSAETLYLVPAPLPGKTAAACRDAALAAFHALGCRGLGRVDFRLTADGKPVTLELNSIPGFTETSLLPKAAKAAGIGFSELCDRIMRGAATD